MEHVRLKSSDGGHRLDQRNAGSLFHGPGLARTLLIRLMRPPDFRLGSSASNLVCSMTASLAT